MRMFEDLSVVQIQSCLTDDIDITLFKRVALETQKLMRNYDNNGNDAYSISEGSTAALYCKEIINTFSSQEHTEAWELEFNSYYESVQAAGFKINDLLKAE